MGSTRRRTAKTRIGLLVAGITPALLAPAFLAPALARASARTGRSLGAGPRGRSERAGDRPPHRPVDRPLAHRRPAARRQGGLRRQPQGRQRHRALDPQDLRDRHGRTAQTSIFVMDADGRQIARSTSIVGRDLNVLRQTLRTRAAEGAVQDQAGRRHDPADRRRHRRARRRSRRWTSPRASSASPAACRQRRQGRGGQLGHDPRQGPGDAAGHRGRGRPHACSSSSASTRRAAGRRFDFLTNAVYSLSNQVLAVNNRVSGSVQRGGNFANATLQAFERAGVSRMLAEPTLTAISGEAAKFTAGGEIPIPKSESCTRQWRVARATCTIGLEFKPYGVTLNFTPVVLSERPDQPAGLHRGDGDRLREPVQVRHGQRAGHEGAQIGDDVELPSGATMMTAGLIQPDLRPGDQRRPGPPEPADARRAVPLARLPAQGNRADDHGDALHRQADGGRPRSPGRTTASSRRTTRRPCCSAD